MFKVEHAEVPVGLWKNYQIWQKKLAKNEEKPSLTFLTPIFRLIPCTRKSDLEYPMRSVTIV